jgi:hypothetical protein
MGSQNHALVSPLANLPLMLCFIGGFLFFAKFEPCFPFLEVNRVLSTAQQQA